jgi:hypothetical protein
MDLDATVVDILMIVMHFCCARFYGVGFGWGGC